MAPYGDAARWAIAAARHQQLRRQFLRLGAGAHLEIAPDARIEIGPGMAVRRDLTLLVEGRLSIGRGLFCNRSVAIAAMRDVTIGDRVRIGERTSIIDHNHVIEPLGDEEARFSSYDARPVRIGDRVLISANCVVLAGVTVGDDAVIGAGSVVTRDVPAGVLAAGVPARPLRDLMK